MAKPYPYFVSLNEAISLCQKTSINIGSEIIPISQSINRIVSSDIKAKVNDPGFDNSAMDGFAVVHSDTTSPPSQLSIIGSSMAGSTESHTLSSGQAIRIMTVIRMIMVATFGMIFVRQMPLGRMLNNKYSW